MEIVAKCQDCGREFDKEEIWYIETQNYGNCPDCKSKDIEEID